MLISGIQPLTLLDYPDRLACVVFTPGCNFRCGFCHNPEFVLPERIIKLKEHFIPEEYFFSFLEERRGLLDGVVVSGGEPTLAPDLIKTMKKIKALGFLVKLDTNGNRPDVLKKALETGVVDYVAMDVKTSLEEYPRLVGPLVNMENIRASIELLRGGNVEYEFRTTLVKELHTDAVLGAMAGLLHGSKRLYLQTFRPGITLSSTFKNYHPFSPEETNEVALHFQNSVEDVRVR